jgi:Ca-activated chloride channel family protein
MLPYAERRSRAGTVVVVIAAVAFAALVIYILVCGQGGCGPTSRTTPTPASGTAQSSGSAAPAAGTTEVFIFSSNTKEAWLDALIADFNSLQRRTASNQVIVVRAEHGNSGDRIPEIIAGDLQPTVWSPGDQSWVKKMNAEWQLDHPGQLLIPDACQGTVYSPIGIAMWRDMAEAMGWPTTSIGWDDILDLMADPAGWGRYGHSEWGPLRFGHTDPNDSNSALLLLTALAYSVWGVDQGLTIDMVQSQSYIDAMRTVGLHTYHYGNQSRDNVSRMVQIGQSFVHATNTSEREALRANLGEFGPVVYPLAFIIPEGGTFWSEHPYCILNAPWVSTDQHEAAQLFEDFLHEQQQQARAVEYYLRPTLPGVALADPFSLANGTDPNQSPATTVNLEGPEPAVLTAVQDVFNQPRRIRAVVLLVDVSSSMTPTKMKAAAEAAAQYVEGLGPNDEIYAYLFSDAVVPLTPSGAVGQVGEELAARLRTIIAGGQTVLNDAICEGAAKVEELRAAAEDDGESILPGIVVLSDGRDFGSQRTPSAECLLGGRRGGRCGERLHNCLWRRRRPDLPHPCRQPHLRPVLRSEPRHDPGSSRRNPVPIRSSYMAPSKAFWFLRNWQAWLVLGMGVVTALITGVTWIISLGVIGFLLVLLFEAGLDPRSLMRAAHAEQENRAMYAERARLLGGLKELQARNAELEALNRQLTQDMQAARSEIENLKMSSL